MAPLSALLQLSACAGLLVGQASAAAIDRRSTSAYAPISASCPSTPLVRDATSLGSSEAAYYAARKPKADLALAAWLQKTDSSFATTDLPSVGLVLSGGGYRALLSGAGVVQGMDARDSTSSTAGLFQALTYHTSLSGGSWMSSSFIGNNWPTVSWLRDNLWEDHFADSLLVPAKLLSFAAYAEIVKDIVAKANAGFSPTLVDVYGRLLGYQLYQGTDGGVAKTLSAVTTYSNFTNHAVPYPIITSKSVNRVIGECEPTANETQIEFGPFEFGSWDEGVKAFTQTAYLGSQLTNGKPTVSNKCIKNFDNLGYVSGTSSDIFNEYCTTAPVAQNNTDNLLETLEAIVLNTHSPVVRDLYAPYPNPFYQYATSSLISGQTELTLADGGEAWANVPLWPLIQPSRNVDVIIVSDNSADTADLWPSGIAMQTAYEQAQLRGLTKMPFFPDADDFVAAGLNKRANFFGCNDNTTATIVYLPNADFSYASNIETVILETSKAETAGIIANGAQVVAQGGDEEWPVCLGCAIMQKTGTALPEACTACFDKYCYEQ